MSDQPTTVYAVSYGSYSDYGVHCLFTTHELAVEYGGESAVEEFQLWDHQPEKFDTYEIYANVELNAMFAFDGSTGNVLPTMKHTVMDETNETGREHKVYIADRAYNMGSRWCWFVKVEGTDRDRVQADFDAAVIEARLQLAQSPDPRLAVPALPQNPGGAE